MLRGGGRHAWTPLHTAVDDDDVCLEESLGAVALLAYLDTPSRHRFKGVHEGMG